MIQHFMDFVNVALQNKGLSLEEGEHEAIEEVTGDLVELIGIKPKQTHAAVQMMIASTGGK